MRAWLLLMLFGLSCVVTAGFGEPPASDSTFQAGSPSPFSPLSFSEPTDRVSTVSPSRWGCGGFLARFLAIGGAVVVVGGVVKWIWWPETTTDGNFVQYFRDPDPNTPFLGVIRLQADERLIIRVKSMGRDRGNPALGASYLVRLNMHYLHWVERVGTPTRVTLAESNTISLPDDLPPGNERNIQGTEFSISGVQMEHLIRGVGGVRHGGSVVLNMELLSVGTDIGWATGRMRFRQRGDVGENEVVGGGIVIAGERAGERFHVEGFRGGVTPHFLHATGAWVNIELEVRRNRR